MGISAVVLTKNEERNIRECLRHLSWINAVIVVDSGSRDATVEIARGMGAQVFIHVAEPFFVTEQRNWALDHTDIQSEWVLFVDADEVITDVLRDQILRAVAEAQPDVMGFQLCPKFMFMGCWLKHTQGFPAWHDRLLRFGRVRWRSMKWGGWERFDTDGRVGRIHEPYLHYGFNNGMDAWIDRHQWNAHCEAQELLGETREAFGLLLRRAVGGDRRAWRKVAERVAGWLLCISPVLRFLYHYVVKLGFLDGKAGFVYSRMMAMYQFMIYLAVLELKHRRKSLPL